MPDEATTAARDAGHAAAREHPGEAGGALLGRYVIAASAARAADEGMAPALALLVAGVGSMAVDGTNSLLLDLGLPHLYQPHNDLRLATGLLTGIALAVAIAYMLATTLWRQGFAGRRVVTGVGEFGALVALQLPFAALVRSGAAWLYVPMSLVLVLSATAVVAALALVVLTVVRRRENSYDALGELDGAATAALMTGLVVMALIAGGRFWLEYQTGVQPLP
jgi:hypothetical protein